MTEKDKEEYDALKECLEGGDEPCTKCCWFEKNCDPSEMISRLLILHGEMVAREILKECFMSKSETVNSYWRKELLDIARKAGS